jgi:hypothetical protein
VHVGLCLESSLSPLNGLYIRRVILVAQMHFFGILYLALGIRYLDFLSTGFAKLEVSSSRTRYASGVSLLYLGAFV